MLQYFGSKYLSTTKQELFLVIFYRIILSRRFILLMGLIKVIWKFLLSIYAFSQFTDAFLRITLKSRTHYYSLNTVLNTITYQKRFDLVFFHFRIYTFQLYSSDNVKYTPLKSNLYKYMNTRILIPIYITNSNQFISSNDINSKKIFRKHCVKVHWKLKFKTCCAIYDAYIHKLIYTTKIYSDIHSYNAPL